MKSKNSLKKLQIEINKIKEQVQDLKELKKKCNKYTYSSKNFFTLINTQLLQQNANKRISYVFDKDSKTFHQETFAMEKIYLLKKFKIYFANREFHGASIEGFNKKTFKNFLKTFGQVEDDFYFIAIQRMVLTIKGKLIEQSEGVLEIENNFFESSQSHCFKVDLTQLWEIRFLFCK